MFLKNFFYLFVFAFFLTSSEFVYAILDVESCSTDPNLNEIRSIAEDLQTTFKHESFTESQIDCAIENTFINPSRKSLIETYGSEDSQRY